jgi:hypothetical protein
MFLLPFSAVAEARRSPATVREYRTLQFAPDLQSFQRPPAGFDPVVDGRNRSFHSSRAHHEIPHFCDLGRPGKAFATLFGSRSAAIIALPPCVAHREAGFIPEPAQGDPVRIALRCLRRRAASDQACGGEACRSEKSERGTVHSRPRSAVLAERHADVLSAGCPVPPPAFRPPCSARRLRRLTT